MSETTATADKADFTQIYRGPDPRLYCATLSQLDYQIPQNAQPWIEGLLGELATTRRHWPLTVLDVCCSYGTNALLLNHQLDLQQLHARYQASRLRDLGSSELLRDDEQYLATRRRAYPLRILGLDASEPAIRYAVGTKALDAGWAEDLESSAPTRDLAAGIRGADLIICTGGVGYVGHRTFQRILDCLECPDEVWIAMFVLRQIDMTPIRQTLKTHGLDLRHRPDVSLRQRRFASADEAKNAIRNVRNRGLDPTGKEQSGWYFADLFLAHPIGLHTGRQEWRTTLPLTDSAPAAT